MVTQYGTENRSVETLAPSGRQKEYIREAIGLIEKSLEDPRRQAMIDGIKENKQILEDLGVNLDTLSEAFSTFKDAPAPPLMKATLYDQLFRKMYAQNIDLQRYTVKKDPLNDSLDPFLEALKDKVIDDADFEEWKKERIKRHFDEGTVFTALEYDECVEPVIIPYEYCFFDPTALRIHKKGKSKRGAAAWFGFKTVLSRSAFEDYLVSLGREDLVGRVVGGDAVGIEDTDFDESIDYDDPVTIYTFYYVTGRKLYEVKFAGAAAVELVYTPDEKYKHRHNGKPYIPVVCHSSDPKSHKFYSTAWIGMLKDGAEALKKIVNTYLLSVPRSLNPWVLLVGNSSGALVQDMQLFDYMSQAGRTPIISTKNEVDLKTMSPEDLTSRFQAARRAILDEKGSQMGVQFVIQEKTSQRATIFVEQRKDENEATQILKRENKRSDERMLQMSVDLYLYYGDDDEIVSVEYGDRELFADFDTGVTKGFVSSLLEDLDFGYVVDVTVDETLSIPQQVQASDNVTASIINLVTYAKNMGIVSVDQMMPLIDELYDKIVLLGRDNVVRKSKLVEMIEKNLSAGQLPEESSLTLSDVPKVEETAVSQEALDEQLPRALQA